MIETVGAVLAKTVEVLRPLSSSARLDAELLLCEVMHVSRERLLAYPETPLSVTQSAAYSELVCRRCAGWPVAYLLGRQAFYTLELKVTPSVLIPRPETECLVDWVLSQDTQPNLRVLDLGTGSGAIAVTLAVHRPEWSIVAVDYSAAALAVAAENAALQAVKSVTFVQSDWFSDLGDQQFDMIIANPPYIASGDPHLPALAQEPQSALVSAANGLADLQLIVKQARSFIAPGGYLLCEHGADQGQAVLDLAVAAGWLECQCCPDLAGLDRFLLAHAPGR